MFQYYLLFLLLCTGPVSGQLLRSSVAVPYNAVTTYSESFRDPFSFSANQAALANLTNTAAGIYTEKRFLLKEIKTVSAAVSFPCFAGGLGVTLQHEAVATFRQSAISLAYGRALGKNVDLGVQFEFLTLGIEGYGRAAAYTIAAGVILHLTTQLDVGLQVYNPARSKFGGLADERTPSVYSVGLGYSSADKLFLSGRFIKPENRPLNVQVGFHYAFEKQFFIRVGFSSFPAGYFAGAGVSWKQARMEWRVETQPGPGLTPGLQIIYSFRKLKPAEE